MKKKKYRSGFEPPEGYFEEFEERLFDRLNEDLIPKDLGFNVPDGYFEDLEDKLVNDVILQHKEPKLIGLFSRSKLIYISGAAAAIILLFFALNNSSTDLLNLDEVQISSIEEYIEEGNLEFNGHDVMAILSDEDINTLSLDSDIFTDENLEDYILENIDDPTLLIE